MKHRANRVAEYLEKAGITAAAIHGNKSQGARQRALKAFKDGTIRVLVATDIAARGIDIDGITHVVNYELPNEPESYVHRIGRTARAGATGAAVAFCDSSERAYLRDIERLIGMSLTVIGEAPTGDIPEPAKKSGRNGGRRGGGARSEAPNDPSRKPRRPRRRRNKSSHRGQSGQGQPRAA